MLGLASYWPGCYDNYYPAYYGYGTSYLTAYAGPAVDQAPLIDQTAYDYGSPDTAAYADPAADPLAVQQGPAIDQPPPDTTAQSDQPPPVSTSQYNGSSATSDPGAEYFAQAETAFRQGQYREAVRLANHAAVDAPQNFKAHELMSLGMFAISDFRGAALEAHAAAALGPVSDWATLVGYYGDAAAYTTQLRALEKFTRENPKAADARFLMAYHYLMTGQQPAAIEQLQAVTRLAPNDRLAADLLHKNSPADANQNPPLPPPPSSVPAMLRPVPVKPSGNPPAARLGRTAADRPPAIRRRRFLMQQSDQSARTLRLRDYPTTVGDCLLLWSPRNKIRRGGLPQALLGQAQSRFESTAAEDR